ncbi:MAG: hypothetical protein Ta2F_06080 [Termitinemataceae bacterium]|nr:MAG: hypothetical protein Ta2F_06080 [Termitinemataceae bacterium]
MPKTRHHIRYSAYAHVELAPFYGEVFTLLDISESGCCLETLNKIPVEKNETYRLKIQPEVSSKISEFELDVTLFWKNERHSACEYGFKIKTASKKSLTDVGVVRLNEYLEYYKIKRYGKIRQKILKVILSTSLAAVVFLSLTSLLSIINLRSNIQLQSNTMGNSIADRSQAALEEQAKLHLINLVEDKASLTNEKLLEIQNQTKMVSDIACNIYTYKNRYNPMPIDYLNAEQIGSSITHLRTASGVSLGTVGNEVYLAANISDVLRQITVRGISSSSSSYIGTESGFFIVTEAEAPGPAYRTNYDARERPWYKGAKEQDDLFWTPVFEDASGRGASIACAMPFYDLSGGKRILKGVAGTGSVLKDNVNKIVDSTRIGNSGYAFVLNNLGQAISKKGREYSRADENGYIIGDDFLHSQNPDLRKLATQMISGKSGLLRVKIDNDEVFAAYCPLIITGWSIAIVVPIEEVVQKAIEIKDDVLALSHDQIGELNDDIFGLLFSLTVVIVFTAMILVFFSRRLSESLTAPITALSEGARIIGSGNLNYKLVVKSGDEIEMLAESFNLMVRNIKRITSEKERIGTELDVAAHIQTDMLPSVEPDFYGKKEYDIFVSSRPAKEVGGDFYDFFMINEKKLAVVIADVSGKGVPAALFMVIAKTLLKDNAILGDNLNEVFYRVNNRLCENNHASMFVSIFMGVLNINNGKFSYVNAGHNPPLLTRRVQDSVQESTYKFDWLKDKSGLVLGVMNNIDYFVYETILQKDDMLFLYTDGVNEAMNESDMQYGDDRLIETVNGEFKKNSPPESYIQTVLNSIEQFTNGANQADDITMLMLNYKGH